MINYLPQPYNDELVYSLVSRTYAQSGYMHYSYFAKEAFSVSTVRPDFEFLNFYSSEFFSLLTKYKTLTEIICNHTMFPYYGRYMQTSKRIEAYEALCRFDSKTFYNRITMNKSRTCEVRHLRYCPLCVEEDRKKFGETYWRRVHQIRHINICPKHHCYLVNSKMQITSNSSPSLTNAEQCISDLTVEICNIPIECKLTEYVAEVFQSPLNLDLDIRIGDYFKSKLIGTPYLSRRGEKRYMAQLHRDYLMYYEGVNIDGFNERWHMDKLFSSDRYSTYGICLMALFLGISPSDLIAPQIAPISPQNDFDKQIHTLHSQGLNYAQIARQMRASYDVVKAIGEGRYGKYHYVKSNPQKGGTKKKNWYSLDIKLLPKVKNLIDAMNSITEVRPSKVSVGRVERLLGLKERQMQSLPMCKKYIEQHTISQEQFWALTLEWAINKLATEAKPIHYTNIHRLTNIRKRYIESALPYLTDSTAEVIKSLV